MRSSSVEGLGLEAIARSLKNVRAGLNVGLVVRLDVYLDGGRALVAQVAERGQGSLGHFEFGRGGDFFVVEDGFHLVETFFCKALQAPAYIAVDVFVHEAPPGVELSPEDVGVDYGREPGLGHAKLGGYCGVRDARIRQHEVHDGVVAGTKSLELNDVAVRLEEAVYVGKAVRALGSGRSSRRLRSRKAVRASSFGHGNGPP